MGKLHRQGESCDIADRPSRPPLSSLGATLLVRNFTIGNMLCGGMGVGPLRLIGMKGINANVNSFNPGDVQCVVAAHAM